MLLLDERIQGDGRHVRTWASYDAQRPDRIEIRDEDGPSGALPLVAVDRVMMRYGRALDPEVDPERDPDRDPDMLLHGDSVLCGNYRLRRLRYHAVVDAEARDYLVWQRPDGEPVACVAATAAAALRYLVRQLCTVRTSDS